MKTFLFVFAVLSFLWRVKVLHDDRFYFLDLLSVKGESYDHAFTVVDNITRTFTGAFPAALVSAVSLSLVVALNLEKDAAFIQNRAAAALLFLLFLTYGAVFDFLVLTMDSRLFQTSLTRWFGVLLVDMSTTLVPPVLLLLSALGYDFRKPFLLSLAPLIIASLILKFLYMLANFKLF